MATRTSKIGKSHDEETSFFGRDSKIRGAPEEEGIVVKQVDDLVRVRITRSSACASCAVADKCPLTNLGMKGKGEWQVWARNKVSAKMGDKVKIVIAPSCYILIAAIIFILPVVVLLLSYLFFRFIGMADNKAVVSSVFMAFISYFVIRTMERSKLATQSYEVVEVIGQEQPQDES